MAAEHPQDILNPDARVWSYIRGLEARIKTLETGTPLPKVEDVPAVEAGAEGRQVVRAGGTVSPGLLVKIDGQWQELVFTTPR